MMTFPDIRMRALLQEANRAQKLLDDQQYEESRNAFAEVRARAKRLGLDSAYLAWGVAVTSDYLGDTDMAFAAISEALARDPFNPAARHSFDIICGRVRSALAAPERDVADPSTPRLYELLLGAGEADVPSHLAMARWLAAGGKREEAMRILDAVTLLAPASRDSWLAKAALARVIGDEADALRCDAQASALSTPAVPYAIPAPTATC